MRKFAGMVAFGMILVGCEDPMDGVWMFEAPRVDVERSCVTTWESNLRSADLEAPSEAWTDLGTSSGTPELFFARVATGLGDDAVMISGEDVIPGARVDGDTWEFVREEISSDVDGREHRSGYVTRAQTDSTSRVVYTLVEDGRGRLTGSTDVRIETHTVWEESDEWNGDQLGFWYGGLPGELVNGGYNYATDDDCPTPNCQITQHTVCAASGELTGTRTGLDGDAAFDLADAQD